MAIAMSAISVQETAMATIRFFSACVEATETHTEIYSIMVRTQPSLAYMCAKVA